MKRAYTVAPSGLVSEIFSDGRTLIVEKIHPGFRIARMIGARGESPNKFVMIPWQDCWLSELLQQKAVSDYCANRTIPIVDVREITSRASRRKNLHTNVAITQDDENLLSILFDSDADEDVPDPELDDRSGQIEDIISSLRTCCKFANEQELLDQALRIYNSRSSA